MSIGVYCITNMVDGRAYIGSSIHVEKRWSEHQSELRRNVHHSVYLQRAWNKYGKDAFQFRVLMECSKKDMLRLEQLFMIIFQSADCNHGYNMYPIAGSPGGTKATPEVKAQLSQIVRTRLQDRPELVQQLRLNALNQKPCSDQKRQKCIAAKLLYWANKKSLEK